MLNDIGRPLHLFLLLIAFGSPSASYAQATIDPHKAQAFVEAAIVASLVSGTWEPRINRAKSEAEAERLREQEAAAIRQAIREVDGMTVYQYRSMYYEAKRNPELAAYLTELLEQEVTAAKR